jgi:hypothetical protein
MFRMFRMFRSLERGRKPTDSVPVRKAAVGGRTASPSEIEHMEQVEHPQNYAAESVPLSADVPEQIASLAAEWHVPSEGAS